ncbi:MAG: hypothetical protein PUP92_06865 [Rhizonema sp. PD38]|nr:hypothetical protein [Rhizonema sp. PD38]
MIDYFEVKEMKMKRAVEIIPVTISFLVATVLTLSILPQVKGSVVPNSPHAYLQHSNDI